jgi:hypothetical protein
MKTSTFSFMLLTLILLVSSCYTPKGMHTQLLSEPKKPVFDFVVLFVPTVEDIYQLDQTSYEQLIQGNFNDLQHKTFRNHLHNSFSKTFDVTFVHDYQNFFNDHKPYSYEEFVGALKNQGVQHIFLITLKSQNQVIRPIITSDMSIPVNYTDRSYQFYLFDLDKPSPIWVSYGFPTSTGGLNGMKTTTKQLARGAAKELKKGDLLYASNIKS